MYKKTLRAIALVLLMVAALSPASMMAQDGTPSASPVPGPGLQGGVDWLISQQQVDGSWLGFSGEPDAGTTVDAVIALAAAQEADAVVGESIDKAMAWLASGEVALVYAQTGVGQSAKLLLALVATGAESIEIGGVEPLSLIQPGQDAETGLYGFGLYDHAYALMALAITDSEIPANAIEFLGTVQAGNGGFAWDGSTDEAMADSNTTAMIVQALVAVGEGDSEIVTNAIAFLKTTITADGAEYSAGAGADANSTALVAQALIAVDEDASALLAVLPLFQNANGAYHWQHADTTDNAFSTVQAIPAEAGLPLPVIPGMLEEQKAA